MHAIPPFTWSRSFPAQPDQVRHARRFLAQVLDGCPAADDAILCLSELTSNALTHSNSRKPAIITRELYDAAQALTASRDATPGEPGEPAHPPRPPQLRTAVPGPPPRVQTAAPNYSTACPCCPASSPACPPSCAAASTRHSTCNSSTWHDTNQVTITDTTPETVAAIIRNSHTPETTPARTVQTPAVSL
ncbi:MAG TPA: ATP-binding protein [Streptosporangiaceae bacterium]|nr:ATP-binding protein [Streptosporangiaceae bacterium]